jgi:CheY-like chemotaxis protein
LGRGTACPRTTTGMTIAAENTSRPARVLYAEDEPGVAMITQTLLEMEGFAVEHAPNGRAALEKFLQDPARYDAVLTDDAMPEMTGVQLTQELRARGFAGRVVVYSGVVDAAKARTYTALGVSAIVHKLDPLEHLVSALRAATQPQG